jgi:hypothetical protein
MTLLNTSIPYIMKIQALKKPYSPIVFDYFVGGYPNTRSVEMGSFAFYTPDNECKTYIYLLYFRTQYNWKII